MNAITPISMPTALDAGILDLLSSMGEETPDREFHAKATRILSALAEMRKHTRLQQEAFVMPAGLSSDILELEIDRLMEIELNLARWRRAMLSAAERLRAKRSKLYLRPRLNRIVNDLSAATAGSVSFVRDVRMQTIAELATHPQEPDGPVLSSTDDVRRYFASLATNDA